MKKKHIEFYTGIVEKARQIIKNVEGFLITLLTRMEYFYWNFLEPWQLLTRAKSCTVNPHLTLEGPFPENYI